jgi:hypothetical protein
MPAMTEPTLSLDPLELARSLRPQSFGASVSGRIREPVVEPLWSGVRVLAAARGHDALLFDDAGDALEEPVELLDALAAVTATTTTDGVILDAFVTNQVAGDDPGVYTGTDPLPSTGTLIAQSLIGVRRRRREELLEGYAASRLGRDLADGQPVNLVVIDVLWLDGEWLLDVPLLERKRLLESVVPASELIRPGPYVRPPISTWVGSWRAQGFRGLSFKAANSRYRPGESAPDWATTPMPRR